MLDGRVFLSLALFFAFASKNSRYSTSPVDVAVVNGRYTPEKSASKAGTGERLTEQLLSNLRRLGCRKTSGTQGSTGPDEHGLLSSSEAFQIKHSHTSMFYSARKICSI